MNNPFTLEILQAINDWQSGTTTARGKKLEELCVNLPDKYRTVESPCYRKINLKKDGVFSIFAHFCLPERISSWSSSVDIVKSFKHGVSLKIGEQSFIYQTNPTKNEVIINLIAVYKSCDFQNSLKQNIENIKNVNLGIVRYNDSQSEVVLKKEVVTHKDIYMLGGRSTAFCISHSSDIKNLSLSNSVYDITTNTIIVFKWLSPEKTSEVIDRVLRRFPQPFNVYSMNYGYVASKKK